MSLSQLLFSLKGRIGRRTYWLTLLAASGLFALFGLLAWVVFYADPLGLAGLDIAIALLPMLLWGWSGLALAVKRLHDRGRTGWWLSVPMLLPVLAAVLAPPEDDSLASIAVGVGALAWTLWMTVEIGVLRGTRGANAYGADPLDPVQSDAEL